MLQIARPTSTLLVLDATSEDGAADKAIRGVSLVQDTSPLLGTASPHAGGGGLGRKLPKMRRGVWGAVPPPGVETCLGHARH